jgi:hypothetical protein
VSQRLSDLGVPAIFEEDSGVIRIRVLCGTGRLYTVVLRWVSLLLAGVAGGKKFLLSVSTPAPKTQILNTGT